MLVEPNLICVVEPCGYNRNIVCILQNAISKVPESQQ